MRLAMARSESVLSRRVVHMRALQKEFGDDALFTWGGHLVFHDSLKRSRQNIERQIERSLETIATNLEVIRELEEAFEAKNEQDLKDVVNYVRERHGLDKGKK